MIVRDFFRSLSGPETDGCFLLTLGAELADSDEEVKRRVGESLDKTRRMFVELLQREEAGAARREEGRPTGGGDGGAADARAGASGQQDVEGDRRTRDGDSGLIVQKELRPFVD
jgi:hypothetical protein